MAATFVACSLMPLAKRLPGFVYTVVKHPTGQPTLLLFDGYEGLNGSGVIETLVYDSRGTLTSKVGTMPDPRHSWGTVQTTRIAERFYKQLRSD